MNRLWTVLHAARKRWWSDSDDWIVLENESPLTIYRCERSMLWENVRDSVRPRYLGFFDGWTALNRDTFAFGHFLISFEREKNESNATFQRVAIVHRIMRIFKSNRSGACSQCEGILDNPCNWKETEISLTSADR